MNFSFVPAPRAVSLPAATDFSAESAEYPQMLFSGGAMREVFHHGGVGMAFLDASGIILEINASFCRFLGRAHTELLGANIAEISHPEDMWADRRELDFPPGLRPPVVALSAHVGAEHTKRCLQSGMDDVLAKPVSRVELHGILEKFLRKSP
jgi:hypothetical protein